MMKMPIVTLPSARSIARCASRLRFGEFAALQLRADRACRAAPDVNSGRRWTRAGRRVRRPARMLRGIGRARPATAATRPSPWPATPCRRRRWRSSRSSSNPVSAMVPPRQARRWRTTASAARSASPCRASVGCGQSSPRRLAGVPPTRPAPRRRSRRVSHPARAHVPVERRGVGLPRLRGVRLSAETFSLVDSGSPFFDGGGQSPVQLLRGPTSAAIHKPRHESADAGTRIRTLRSEPDLVDQLRLDQLFESAAQSPTRSATRG